MMREKSWKRKKKKKRRIETRKGRLEEETRQ
jgi:hypothetical protein